MEIKTYEAELLNILESNIENKELYINTLADQHPNDKEIILQTYDTWNELDLLEPETPSAKMDQAFYDSLSKMESSSPTAYESKVVQLPPKRSNIFSLQRLGIAMTFLLGLGLGGYFDVFNAYSSQDAGPEVMNNSSMNNSSMVRFASLEKTPRAGDRIKGIIDTKNESELDSKILQALNEVLCNDPNINVRLSAVETLVLFWDNPEAREILIKSIPCQDSPIVQLELADIMISLEASSSSDKWSQLLSSPQVEPDIKSQLENTLKEIL